MHHAVRKVVSLLGTHFQREVTSKDFSNQKMCPTVHFFASSDPLTTLRLLVHHQIRSGQREVAFTVGSLHLTKGTISTWQWWRHVHPLLVSIRWPSYNLSVPLSPDCSATNKERSWAVSWYIHQKCLQLLQCAQRYRVNEKQWMINISLQVLPLRLNTDCACRLCTRKVK